MPGSRRLVALVAATVLVLAVIAFAARGGLGGSEGASGEQAGGSGSTSGSSGSQPGAESDDGGADGATETQNDPPPAAGADAAGEKAQGGNGLPGVGPKGELVPVETAAGPGETLGQQKGEKGKKSGLSVPAVDTGPLVDEPLPKSASSRGRLVRGYPGKALPVVPGSTVRSSSVSASERGLQVAMVGSVARRAEAVAAFYRLALAPYGFDEASVPAVGGSTAYGFSRAKDSLVLTITPQGKKSTYSLFGTLSAGSD